MSFHTSGLRIAGQDSDILDIFFPSSDMSCLPGAGLSPMHGKQMYGNSDSIKSWIETVGRADRSLFKLDDSDDPDLFEFATHPFRTYFPRSPFSDDLQSESDILFPLDALAWAPEMFSAPYYDDSDESHSESSVSDDAQYITIPSDSPWYRPPSPSPGPVSAHEFSTADFANSCSSDVRQAIAQQELLLAIFHEELRRVLPRDHGGRYDSDWLEDVDVDVLLAPLETYADLCWESAVSEKSSALGLDRPIPDVPTGFDEFHGAY